MLSLIIAALPVYLILLYVYNKDRDKEPKNLLIKLFIFGVASAIPAIILEIMAVIAFGDIENLQGIIKFIYVFIGVALIEEVCKWCVLYLKTYNNKEFNHVYDAIVYACFISLGFALFENIFYVFEYGVTIGLYRAISSIPGHACFGIVMGNYFSLAKINDIHGRKKEMSKYLLLSIIVPTILHGLFDYCLLSGSMILFIIFIFILIGYYVYAYILIKRISRVRKNFISDDAVISPSKSGGVG